tara:strand:+ start:3082 stop:3282 length:201 start_codon:yes stop_codon:yes gene_type:complete
MSENNYRNSIHSDPDTPKIDPKGLRREEKKPTHTGEDKAVYDIREAKSNSYHDTNMKLIKDLKRDA